jgi:predicted RNA-binding protein with TRAM domain
MRFKHCVISVSVTLSALGFPARTSPWVGVGNFAKLNIRQLAVGATPGLAEAPNTKSSSSVPLPRKVPKKFVNHPFEYHEEIELDITDLTNLGYGLGRTTLPDGGEWVVMVEYALPGEKVKCRIFKNFNSYSEADLLEVIVSSPDRVEPQCKYYQMCGGCQYQHFSIEGQRAWKKKQVEQVLQRIGKLPDVEVNDVKGTQDLYGYRAKITPHYNAPTESRPLAIGFQQRGTRSVIDVSIVFFHLPKLHLHQKPLFFEICTRLNERYSISVCRRLSSARLQQQQLIPN